MTWASVDDFIGALPGGEAVQISNPPEVFAEVPDRDRIQLSLDQAAGEILSELGGKFDRAVLAVSVSADLAAIQIAIARWNLDRDVVGRPRDFVYKDAEDRRLRLRRISRGEAALEYTPPDSLEPVADTPKPRFAPIVSVGPVIESGGSWWAG